MATAAYVGVKPSSAPTNTSTTRVSEDRDSPETNVTAESDSPNNPFEAMSPDTLDRNWKGAQMFMNMLSAKVQVPKVSDGTKDPAELTETTLSQHEDRASSDVSNFETKKLSVNDGTERTKKAPVSDRGLSLIHI